MPILRVRSHESLQRSLQRFFSFSVSFIIPLVIILILACSAYLDPTLWNVTQRYQAVGDTSLARLERAGICGRPPLQSQFLDHLTHHHIGFVSCAFAMLCVHLLAQSSCRHTSKFSSSWRRILESNASTRPVPCEDRPVRPPLPLPFPTERVARFAVFGATALSDRPSVKPIMCPSSGAARCRSPLGAGERNKEGDE